VISKTTAMEEQAGGSSELRTDGFPSKKGLSQSKACVVERRRRAIRVSCSSSTSSGSRRTWL
jgi:hypothetical protein